MRSLSSQLNLLPFRPSIQVVKIHLLQHVTEKELSFAVSHSSPCSNTFNIFWSSFDVQPFLLRLYLTITFQGLGPSLSLVDVKKNIAADSRIPTHSVLSYTLQRKERKMEHFIYIYIMEHFLSVFHYWPLVG